MSTFSSLVERYKQQHLLFSEDPLNSSDANAQGENSAAHTYSYTSTNAQSTMSKSAKSNMNSSKTNIFLLYSLSNFSDAILPLAVNNLTICALFLKKMNIAITSLENLIKLNPYEYCTNYIIFNLCTLYDLSLTNEQSSVKKKGLYKITLFYDISESVVPFQAFRLN